MGQPIRGTRRSGRVITAFGLGAALTGLGLAGSAIGASGSGKLTSGTVYIAQVPKPSSTIVYNAGIGNDKVFGPNVITFATKAVGNPSGTITVKVKPVVVYTPNGSMSGRATALLTITNKPHPGDVTVTDGSEVLNHGTGRFAGHSLRAAFEGKGNLGSPPFGDFFVLRYKGVYR